MAIASKKSKRRKDDKGGGGALRLEYQLTLVRVQVVDVLAVLVHPLGLE